MASTTDDGCTTQSEAKRASSASTFGQQRTMRTRRTLRSTLRGPCSVPDTPPNAPARPASAPGCHLPAISSTSPSARSMFSLCGPTRQYSHLLQMRDPRPAPRPRPFASIQTSARAFSTSAVSTSMLSASVDAGFPIFARAPAAGWVCPNPWVSCMLPTETRTSYFHSRSRSGTASTARKSPSARMARHFVSKSCNAGGFWSLTANPIRPRTKSDRSARIWPAAVHHRQRSQTPVPSGVRKRKNLGRNGQVPRTPQSAAAPLRPQEQT